jgi:DNA-binding HxlR family transcriptional regulator
MATRAARGFGQYGGVARALERVGERWALLIVRDLLVGPRRYGDLKAGLPRIPTNILADRLKELQEAGVVRRVPMVRGGYELTALGRELEPVVLALGRFGARWLVSPAADDRVDPRWAMVSLKRRYVGCPRGWRVGLHVGELPFALELGGERLEVSDGVAREPDLVLRGERQGFAALLLGGASARALVDEGRLVREGPARALTDFARAFELEP